MIYCKGITSIMNCKTLNTFVRFNMELPLENSLNFYIFCHFILQVIKMFPFDIILLSYSNHQYDRKILMGWRNKAENYRSTILQRYLYGLKSGDCTTCLQCNWKDIFKK